MTENPRANASDASGADARPARRRRRRSRRRRSGHAAKNTAHNTAKNTSTGGDSQGGRGAQNKPHASGKNSKNTKNGNSGKTGKNSRNGSKRSSSRQRSRGGRPRNTGTAAQRRTSPARRAPVSSSMPTRHETSAGGLVISGLAEAVSERGNVDMSRLYVALIGRLDRRRRLLWSMPKGHVEADESTWTTAEREVWEETGISGEVIAELGVIDYWFVSEGVRIHKTVHHHLLRFVDGVLNDEDPEVTEVAWIPVSQLIEHLAYADERKLARTALNRLPELARAEKAAGRVTPR